MKYTKEEIEKAKDINLVEFARRNGIDLKEENNGTNKAYRVINNRFKGGFYLYENSNGFYHFQTNTKGNAIDFCKIFFNDDYLQAIKRLRDYKGIVSGQPDSKKQENDKNINKTIVSGTPDIKNADKIKDFQLPNRDDNVKIAYAYLLNTRKINKNIIDKCIKEGIIRQFKEDKFTYVGFIGKDKEENPRYLMLRSTLSNTSFKKEYHNSSKNYGFKVFDKESVRFTGQNIYIFESPIDLLSFMSINSNIDIKYNTFLSMGGLNDLTLKQFIEDYKPDIKSINICFDNDEAGQNYAKILKEQYLKGYKVCIMKPTMKDYNEELQVINKYQGTNNNENIKEQGINQKASSLCGQPHRTC